MTLQEIFHRIVRAHLLVIATCTLLPLVAVVLLERSQAQAWEGSVRIQVVSGAPVSTTEADAVSSRVLALATTPTLVSRALSEAGLTGDATEVAQHDVTASRLGESSVVDVTVTESSADRARKLATSLVTEVVTFMNNGSRPALDARLRELSSEIDRTDAHRRALTARIPLTPSRVQRQALTLRIQAAQAQVNALASQRSALLQAKLGTDQAVVIDGDNPEVREVASALIPLSALALVLGLIAGLAMAVLMETLSPRVAGPRALARTLGTPLLGRTDESPEVLATTLTMAARRQGVETVVVMGVDERDAAAVRRLLATMPAPVPPESGVKVPPKAGVKVQPKAGAKVPPRATAGASSKGRTTRQAVSDPFATVRVRFTSLQDVATEDERTAGVVVVSDGSAHVRDLDRLQDRLTAVRWPVIGLVQVSHRKARSTS
jgi:capsular polysaccharide biosynthesis protein